MRRFNITNSIRLAKKRMRKNAIHTKRSRKPRFNQIGKFGHNVIGRMQSNIIKHRRNKSRSRNSQTTSRFARNKTIYGHNKTVYGGKVIGTGAYGCVFSPPLKCKYAKERLTTDKFVTKFMDADEALSEMADIRKVLQRVSDIPNYEKYTLLKDANVCEVDDASITDEDIQGKSCPSIINYRKGFTDDDEVKLLQLPKGGIEVDEYLDKGHYNDLAGLQRFFKSMNELLINMIVPMNERGIYHQDIKGANILVNENHEVQLIDWGLMTMNTQNNSPITKLSNNDHNMTMHGMVMYNSPLSVPFLIRQRRHSSPKADYKVNDVYKYYLQGAFDGKTKLIYNNLHNYLKNSQGETDAYGNPVLPAHLTHFITRTLKPAVTFLNQHGALNTNSTTTVLNEYVKQLYARYTVGGSSSSSTSTSSSTRQFDIDKFTKDYYHNVDLYGWAISFTHILSSSKMNNISTYNVKRIIGIVANLIVYLVTDGAIRIDPRELVNITSDIFRLKDKTVSSVKTTPSVKPPQSPRKTPKKSSSRSKSSNTVIHHTPKSNKTAKAKLNTKTKNVNTPSLFDRLFRTQPKSTNGLGSTVNKIMKTINPKPTPKTV